MELRVYLAILWRRKWMIIITAIITVAVTLLGTLMMTPKYVAVTTLRVSTNDREADLFDVALYTEVLMNTYAKIVTSSPVMAEMQQRLNIEVSPKIEVKFIANSELMQIEAEDRDPILAAEAANTLAEILITQSRKSKVERNFTVSLIDPAVAPNAPAKPRKTVNLALGIMVGLAGGLGLAFLFENLDTKLYTTEQIEAASELATLGQIPKAKKRQQITFLNGNSPEGEAFRRLRTNLFIPAYKTPIQALLITSAEPGEGKSTVVANLAYAIAQSGQEVIVVDGDLRLPTLHKIFDLSNEVGLSSLLKEEATPAEAVQAGDIPRVQVLTSGPLPSNPAELLGSPQMVTLIEQLRQQFDLVLLDTPALLAVTDAAVLAPMVDGVILVVGRAQARQETVRAARQQLANVKARLVGVVVNRANRADSYYSYYYPFKTKSD